jgi:hypothetical protein
MLEIKLLPIWFALVRKWSFPSLTPKKASVETKKPRGSGVEFGVRPILLVSTFIAPEKLRKPAARHH